MHLTLRHLDDFQSKTLRGELNVYAWYVPLLFSCQAYNNTAGSC